MPSTASGPFLNFIDRPSTSMARSIGLSLIRGTLAHLVVGVPLSGCCKYLYLPIESPMAMGRPTKDEVPAAAWRSVMSLVGWGSGRPPRVPAVARQLGLSPKQLV